MIFKNLTLSIASRFRSSLGVGMLLLTFALATGCGQTEIASEAPQPPEGVAMLRNFLTQVADPDKPMPQMFGIEPAYQDALRLDPEKAKPLKSLYNRLKGASTDTQRRKIASQMLEKLD